MLGREGLILGDYKLLRRLGRGGMGSVWRAEHRSGLEVAVKLFSELGPLDSTVRSGFHNELQAVARLNHPNIALLLDVGEVQQDAGGLQRGTPFLVMELASGGTLLSAKKPLPWEGIRHTLFCILKALAHSHARDMIHRDLKPGNILLSLPKDTRPGLKLIDFGLVQMMDELDALELTLIEGGTPRYIAPEQLRGQSHRVGPWTDLYSLGCISFVLATGRPPFYGEAAQVIRDQVFKPAPMLRPKFPCPEGFPRWVARLLEKQPERRFQTAADALFALLQLENGPLPSLHQLPHGLRPSDQVQDEERTELSDVPELSSFPSSQPRLDSTNTLPPQEQLEASSQPSQPTPSSEALPAVSFMHSTPALQIQPPPLPEDWDPGWESLGHSSLMLFLGIGLNLCGLRRLPLVGRTEEKELLWKTLAQVHAQKETRVVVLRGPAGTGKTALAQWLTRRAYEVGGAIPYLVRHSPTPGPFDGLRAMLVRMVRLRGLSYTQAHEQMLAWMASHGSYSTLLIDVLEALLEMEDPDAESPSRKVEFRDAEERHQALLRILSMTSQHRPLLLHIDDVQWGPDALEFCREALKSKWSHEQPLSALIVLTVQEELLVERPKERALLEELLEFSEVQELEIAALSRSNQLRMIEELLGLSPTLAHRIWDRTQGNPLFAVQLISDWIHAGALQPTEQGFALDPELSTSIPDDLFSLWSQSLERALPEPLERSKKMLELAAVLGDHVLSYEWGLLCEECRCGNALARQEIQQILEEKRLIEPDEEGWTFVHPMLRESLQRWAQESDRWRQHHAAAAACLLGLYGEGAKGVEGRMAQHWFHAREYEAAVEPLLSAAKTAKESDQWSRVHQLLDLHQSAMDACQLEDHHPQRIEARMLAAEHLYVVECAFEQAEAMLNGLLEHEQHPNYQPFLPEIMLALGLCAYYRQELDRAGPLFEQTLTLAASHNEGDIMLSALLSLADVDYYSGRRKQCTERYRKAYSLAQEIGSPKDIERALFGLAYVLMWAGQPSEELFIRLLEFGELEGSRVTVAKALSGLAEQRLWRGDLEGVVADFQRALDTYESMGSRGSLNGKLNIAVAHIFSGEIDRAESLLVNILPLIRHLRLRSAHLIGQCALLACLAATQRWPRFEEMLAQVKAFLKHFHWYDGDIPSLLELSGKAAEDAGMFGLALDVYQIVVKQWHHIEREDKIEALQPAIERCQEELS